MTNIDQIQKLSKRHQILSMVLSGYSRQAIIDELGVSEAMLQHTLSNIKQELDNELTDLRETFMAVAVFRLEDLYQRNMVILNKLEEPVHLENPSKAALNEDGSLRFSVKDYNAITKTIMALISQQTNLILPAAEGRPSKNGGMTIEGMAEAAANAPTSLSETDDMYLGLLNEIAEDADFVIVDDEVPPGEEVLSAPEAEEEDPTG